MEEGATKEELKEVSEEIDEEVLCNICYSSEKDTEIVPCGHQTCLKCIQVHTQNR